MLTKVIWIQAKTSIMGQEPSSRFKWQQLVNTSMLPFLDQGGSGAGSVPEFFLEPVSLRFDSRVALTQTKSLEQRTAHTRGWRRGDHDCDHHF